MTVPYLLRFCPYRASILWQSVTQGVASLALGYALVGLSARPRLNQKLQSATLAFIATIFLSPLIIPPHHFQHIGDVGA